MKRYYSHAQGVGKRAIQIMAISIFLTTVMIGSGSLSVAHAQFTQSSQFMYVAKFVCGFKEGFTPPQAPFFPPPPPTYDYQDFEPGSYSTALNIFFPNLLYLRSRVDVRVSIPEPYSTPPVTSVLVKSLTPSGFGTWKVDCTDIFQVLDPQKSPQVKDRQLVEGFLYFTRPSDDSEVHAVYTYSSHRSPEDGNTGLGSSIDTEKIEPRITESFLSPAFK